MRHEHNNFYVITGGPGCGKTTMLEALQKRNYTVVPEDARQIIAEQTAMNGNALPWKDRILYQQLMMDRSVATYKAHINDTGILLFDRGIIDALCYGTLIGIPDSATNARIASQYRYNKKVFILPPWKEIYTTDTERKQTWTEAVATYEQMAATYLQHGYQLTEVPRLPVNERASFVEKKVSGLEFTV
ncbi:MAG: AAA family ATPase [Agriterribacter sp.]